MNDGFIDSTKINEEETFIIAEWWTRGYIAPNPNRSLSFTRLYVTKEFWDFMNEILWYTYANHEEK